MAVLQKRGAVFWKDVLSLSIKRKHVSLSTKIVTKHFCKNYLWTGEMVPCVKSFFTKPDDLSLVSGTHSRAGEIKLHSDHP